MISRFQWIGNPDLRITQISYASLSAVSPVKGHKSRIFGAKARRVEGGFTLLEILVGMVLLAIMMSLLFGVIGMGARVWDAGEKRAASVDRMLVIHSFLRKHLAVARPVFDDFSSDESIFSFSGTSDSIRFVSDIPSSARRGGIHQFALELSDEGDSKVLYAKLKIFYPPLEGVDSEIEDVRLIDEVDNIELAYFGVDEIDVDDTDAEDSDAKWLDEWEDKDFMPVLVRLVVRLSDGTEWPPMIVNPKIVPPDLELLTPFDETVE